MMANVKHKMYVIVRLSCDIINMVIKPIEIVTEYYWKITRVLVIGYRNASMPVEMLAI